VKEFTDGSYVAAVIISEEKNQFRKQKILLIREIIDKSLNFEIGQNWIPVNEKTYIYVRKKKKWLAVRWLKVLNQPIRYYQSQLSRRYNVSLVPKPNPPSLALVVYGYTINSAAKESPLLF